MSAWCSQGQACERWYCSKASSETASSPALPSGRSRRSTSYRRPDDVMVDSHEVMRRPSLA
ncbi:Uncharacterised protein [Bordetella pertussis]|nr:Uncharacterised protein [Bordetella pertussis]CFV97517.1 Uncharacterised protein [Bordetella pertussis]CFW30798.1 Uncharacterised protein [Bordetella pertussis]